jgi:hypothetical protein
MVGTLRFDLTALRFHFPIQNFKQLNIRVRNLAARSARVVHEPSAQKNRGRRESRVPVAPAASRAK